MQISKAKFKWVADRHQTRKTKLPDGALKATASWCGVDFDSPPDIIEIVGLAGSIERFELCGVVSRAGRSPFLSYWNEDNDRAINLQIKKDVGLNLEQTKARIRNLERVGNV